MNAHMRLDRCGLIEAGADGVLRILFEPGQPRTALDASRAGCADSDCRGCAGAGRPRSLALGHLAGVLVAAVVPEPGDRVELSVSGPGLTRVAGWAFGVPLAGMLAGAWLGSLVAGEWWSITLGVVGLAGGLAGIRLRGAGLVGLLELRARTPPAAGAGKLLPELPGASR